ncbi:MAG TPA: hypothetical protein VGN34_05545, partial [Ktedonobacteraceae bacterium]
MRRFLLPAIFLLVVIQAFLLVVPIRTAPVNAMRSSYSEAVAYADFTGDTTGRFTFTDLPGDKTRVTGQWNTGFSSADVGDYSFTLENEKGEVINDLTQDIAAQIHINVPGTSPFQKD